MARRSRSGSVTVVGIPEFETQFAELVGEQRSAAVDAVAEETREVADEMRRDAPVGEARRGRRGRPPLAESIEVELDGEIGRAKATARHAHLVEEGTKSHPAQPFAQPAAERARKRLPERVTRHVREATSKG